MRESGKGGEVLNFWHSVFGSVRVELTCADPGGALGVVVESGIPVWDAQEQEVLTVTFRVRRRDMTLLENLAQRKLWHLKLSSRIGLYWRAVGLLRRPVLLIGMVILLAASAYLPSRVFFIRVEGNSAVPTRLILEKAEACGIGFGASRRLVRSQRLKDALMEAVPQLQWAGVTTSGCVATITVRERTEEPEPVQGGVSSILAGHDGVILSMTVTRGTARFTPGQAVRAGDVLISGYTDCGFCIRADRAEGEVFAQTRRELTALTPENWQAEGQNPVSEKKYALIIGKKRINFYKGSGISGTTCDKMYVEYYLTLPGGFQLPVCIVTETWTQCERASCSVAEESAFCLLSDFAEGYLAEQMTAGSVTDRQVSLSAEDGFYCLTGQYACIEMIGRQRNEEIITPNGKYN